ncbi:MAG: FtsX-like permease family protein [Planctomycetota bacterium]
MRAAWRLAISSVSARPSRASLLVAAVALSAALISAVACGFASANGAIELQMERQLGSAEVRLTGEGAGSTFDAEWLETVKAWDGVERTVPRKRNPLSLRTTLTVLDASGEGYSAIERPYAATGYANGVDLSVEFDVRPPEIITGRVPERDGEVMIDALFAEKLSFAFVERRRDVGEGSGYSTPGTEIEYLDLPVPDIAGGASSPEAALALNEAVGVRPGDAAEAVQQFRTPVSLDRVGVSQELQMGLAQLFSRTVPLEVVGISAPPPLGGLPQAMMSLDSLASITGDSDQLDLIELDLADGVDPEAFVARYLPDVGEGLVLQTTEKVTSGLEQNLASNQIGFILASMLAMLSAAFIIMTGMTTAVAEQQRSLAILRCIGATRGQMALGQLFTGLGIGLVGSLIGTPMGVGFAAIMIWWYSDFVPSGLAVPLDMVTLSGLGAVLAGVLGAAWPAWQVARTSPLKGLSGRAHAARPVQIWRVLGFALLGITIQAITVGLPTDKDTLFWGYATVGLPAMFVGYFLLSVPVVVVVSRLVSGPLSRLLGLPGPMLGRAVGATPFRHGFTAGAMMAGLALMISIWTNGGSVLRDWLGRIEFPDAFVNGLRLPPEAQDQLEAIDWVDETCAITIHPVKTDAFGVAALQSYTTSFVAFEPTEFFEMTSLTFFEGDAETALARLEAGGAIIVAREFQVAQGVGVGDVFTVVEGDERYDFEIVGVVTSPGLSLASKFFNIGEEYIDQSVHAVFGSRGDMKERFGSDNIQLLQVDIDWEKAEAAAAIDGIDAPGTDQWAIEQMRERLFGLGVLDAGSGRRIKREIIGFVGGSLVVFSAVAVVSMLVACFGVANLIVAGIESRRFEFGVLRAVGAERGQLVKLVLGEAVIVALTAGVVGTLMGIQGAWAGARIYELLLGLLLTVKVPVDTVVLGWGVVMFFSVGAAAPAMWRLNRRKTRELLSGPGG